MTRVKFETAELDFIKTNARMKRRDLHAAFVKRFKRHDVTPKKPKRCCENRGWNTGSQLAKCAQPGATRMHYGTLVVRTDTPKNWRAMHRDMWEELIGPIPKDHLLLPVNDDKIDLDPRNWFVVSRCMYSHLRGFGFFDAPLEPRPTIFAAAKLKQALEDRMQRRFR